MSPLGSTLATSSLVSTTALVRVGLCVHATKPFCTRCYPSKEQAKKPILTRAEGEKFGYVKEPFVLSQTTPATTPSSEDILANATAALYPTPKVVPEELPVSWRKAVDKAVDAMSDAQKRRHVA